MKRLIAMSLVAFAHSAFAGATYGTSDYNNIERAVSEFAQPEQIEETGSAATGGSTPSDGESAAADGDSESPADIHL